MGGRRDIPTCYLCDLSAVDEAAGSARRYWAMGVLDDEKAFLSAVKSLDLLLGRKNTPKRTDAVVYDRSRSYYFDVLVSLARETKMTMREMDRALQDIVEAFTDEKGRIDVVSNPGMLVPVLIKWLRHARNEPIWHMKARGDTRSLPSAKDKDLWGYLSRLYCDPEKVRLREPDYVRRLKGMYPGYEDCLRRARVAATEEMKRRYGNDVDLSPVTDLPRHATAGEQEFVDMLMHGELALGRRTVTDDGSAGEDMEE